VHATQHTHTHTHHNDVFLLTVSTKE